MNELLRQLMMRAGLKQPEQPSEPIPTLPAKPDNSYLQPQPVKTPITRPSIFGHGGTKGSFLGKHPDMLFGLGNPISQTGSLNEVDDRNTDRLGLPGTLDGDSSAVRQHWTGTSTPLVDPRLVDPKNNPMLSHGQLQRGDINLDTGQEDKYPALMYWLAQREIK